MATRTGLFVRKQDADRLRGVPYLPVLIGDYDGTSDIFGLARCLSVVGYYNRLAPNVPKLVVIEAGRRIFSPEDWHAIFPDDVMPAYFTTETDDASLSDFQELAFLPKLLLHFYGGTYISDARGDRKRAQAEAVTALTPGFEDNDVVFSGVRLCAGPELHAWAPWFACAKIIGLRDRTSLSVLKDAMGAATEAKATFSADDSISFLMEKAGPGRQEFAERIAVQAKPAPSVDVILSSHDGDDLEYDVLIESDADEAAADAIIAAVKAVLPDPGAARFSIRDISRDLIAESPIAFGYKKSLVSSYDMALFATLADGPAYLDRAAFLDPRDEGDLLDCLAEHNEPGTPGTAATLFRASAIAAHHACRLACAQVLIDNLMKGVAAKAEASASEVRRLEILIAEERQVSMSFARKLEAIARSKSKWRRQLSELGRRIDRFSLSKKSPDFH